MQLLWQLFISFLKIGAFTFGGGYAMIPLIRREVVDKKQWVKESDFLELLTLAQSAPGPIALNTAVFVGYKIGRFAGAVTSVAGVVLPAFATILLVAIFFTSIRNNAFVDAAFKAMRPAVVALIVAPIIGFTKQMRWYMALVAIAVAAAIWWAGISPIYLLLAGAITGLIYTLCLSFAERRKEANHQKQD